MNVLIDLVNPPGADGDGMDARFRVWVEICRWLKRAGHAIYVNNASAKLARMIGFRHLGRTPLDEIDWYIRHCPGAASLDSERYEHLKRQHTPVLCYDHGSLPGSVVVDVDADGISSQRLRDAGWLRQNLLFDDLPVEENLIRLRRHARIEQDFDELCRRISPNAAGRVTRLLERVRTKRKIAGGLFGVPLRLRLSPPVVAVLATPARRRLHRQGIELDALQRRLVADLREHGVATTHLAELFPGGAHLPTLRNYVDARIAHAAPGRKKRFLRYLWGEEWSVLDLDNPWVALALAPRVLEVFGCYADVCLRLYLTAMSTTIPVNADTPWAQSQRWHRDPHKGGGEVCKMFCYLSDVDANDGPFMYARATHRRGRLQTLLKNTAAEHGYAHYLEHGAFEGIAPAGMVVPCTGVAGTIIFADTTGIHRGGLSTADESGRPRIMGTAEYTSPASAQPIRFTYPASFLARGRRLPELSRAALGLA